MTRRWQGHDKDTTRTRQGHDKDTTRTRQGHDKDTTRTRQGHDKDMTRDVNETLLSLSCLRATCQQWLKKKKQLTAVPPGRFAGALYHDDAPRDFGPRIAYANWRCFFPIPCPRQGSKGGRSRPQDHMRQIPFVLAPQLNWDSAMYIYEIVVIVFSMWYVLRFEHAHVLKLI